MALTSIVLVDDQETYRQLIRGLLDKAPGMQVVGDAEDGPAAVRLLGDMDVDVVITDVVMPKGGGVLATRQSLAAVPGIKVIALSMHSDTRFVEAMLSAGASGYVLKDHVAHELVVAIRAVVAGRIHLGSGIHRA